mgnify:CR=1 FL=1
MDAIIKQLTDFEALLTSGLAESAELRTEITNLKELIVSKDKVLDEKDKVLDEKDIEINKLKDIISHMEDGEGVCDFVDTFIQKDQDNVNDMVARNTILEEQVKKGAQKLEIYRQMMENSYEGVNEKIDNMTIKKLRSCEDTSIVIGSTISIKFLRDYINTLYDAYADENGMMLLTTEHVLACKQDDAGGAEWYRSQDSVLRYVSIGMSHHIDDETTADNIYLFINMIHKGNGEKYPSSQGLKEKLCGPRARAGAGALCIKPDIQFHGDIVDLDDIWFYCYRGGHNDGQTLVTPNYTFHKPFRSGHKYIETNVEVAHDHEAKGGLTICFRVKEVE